MVVFVICRYNLLGMERFTVCKGIFWLFLIHWFLVACSNGVETPTATIPSVTPSATLLPTFTPTPFQPSPTPVPLAAIVNGEEITLADFHAELARYKASQLGAEADSETDVDSLVIEDLINRVLFAQGVGEAGFVVDDATLDDRMNRLISEVGGEQALTDWLASNGYTLESFKKDLERSIAVAWMRDQILDTVPKTVEQVHIRQILLYNSDEANDVLTQLEAGKDFATLATVYEPITLGDLGWFPKDYLAYKQLEDAAFSLQPGEYSGIIETPLGYHILQLVERDPEHLLDPDARLAWNSKALLDWLEKRRDQSEINIYLP